MVYKLSKLSKKEQALYDKIKKENKIKISELEGVELGCLGKLKQRGLVQVKGIPRRERHVSIMEI